MGNAQYKAQNTSPIKRRKSSLSSLSGAITKFHQKQSSAATAAPKNVHDISTAEGSASASGISRSASGTDITEKNYSQFIPTEKLAKVNHFVNFTHDCGGITPQCR